MSSNAASSMVNRGLSPNNNIIGVLGQATTSSISSRNANSVNSSPNLTSIHSARSSISSIEKPSLQDINTPYNSYFSNQRVSGQQSQHTNNVVAITTNKASSSSSTSSNNSLQSSSRLALHDVEYQQGYFDSSSDSCIDDHQGLLSSLRENSTEYRDLISQLPMPSTVPSSVSSLHHLQFEDLPPVANTVGGMPTIVSKKGYRSQEHQRGGSAGGYGSYFQNTSLNTTTTSGLIPSNHNSISRDDFSVSSREYEQSLGGVPPPSVVPYTDHPRSQVDYNNKNREYDHTYYSYNNQSQRYPSGSNIDYNNIPPSTTTYPTTTTLISSSQQYNGAQTGQFDSRDNSTTVMYGGEQYSDRNKPRYFRNKRYDTSQQFK